MNRKQLLKRFFSQVISEKGEENLETAVATLLLVVAAAVLACSVAAYTVTTIEQTIKAQTLPDSNMFGALENSLNQTLSLNSTSLGIPSSTP